MRQYFSGSVKTRLKCLPKPCCSSPTCEEYAFTASAFVSRSPTERLKAIDFERPAYVTNPPPHSTRTSLPVGHVHVDVRLQLCITHREQRGITHGDVIGVSDTEGKEHGAPRRGGNRRRDCLLDIPVDDPKEIRRDRTRGREDLSTRFAPPAHATRAGLPRAA